MSHNFVCLDMLPSFFRVMCFPLNHMGRGRILSRYYSSYCINSRYQNCSWDLCSVSIPSEYSTLPAIDARSTDGHSIPETFANISESGSRQSEAERCTVLRPLATMFESHRISLFAGWQQKSSSTTCWPIYWVHFFLKPEVRTGHVPSPSVTHQLVWLVFCDLLANQ